MATKPRFKLHLDGRLTPTDSASVAIGKRLRSERKRLGLTQEKFAALGGIKKGTQFLYEAGDRTPDALYLSAVLAQGVDVLYVLSGKRS